ncbi:hypothetical protein [Sphingobium yanoikuyae]|uniref:hypothetical protein n=1 Tax=Sphingobium yanoikuyae TaxID=13690 RepID=UPI0035C73F72
MIDTPIIAKMTGYTRHVIADCTQYTMELLIRPDADLDGTVRAFDLDANSYLTLNGWLWTFEDAEPAAECVTINFVRAAHPGLEC